MSLDLRPGENLFPSHTLLVTGPSDSDPRHRPPHLPSSCVRGDSPGIDLVGLNLRGTSVVAGVPPGVEGRWDLFPRYTSSSLSSPNRRKGVRVEDPSVPRSSRRDPRGVTPPQTSTPEPLDGYLSRVVYRSSFRYRCPTSQGYRAEGGGRPRRPTRAPSREGRGRVLDVLLFSVSVSPVSAQDEAPRGFLQTPF